MFSHVLGWIIDCKTMLQSIDMASVIGPQWVGPNLTMWDIMTILFWSGTLVSIFVHDAESDEDIDDIN